MVKIGEGIFLTYASAVIAVNVVPSLQKPFDQISADRGHAGASGALGAITNTFDFIAAQPAAFKEAQNGRKRLEGDPTAVSTPEGKHALATDWGVVGAAVLALTTAAGIRRLGGTEVSKAVARVTPSSSH